MTTFSNTYNIMEAFPGRLSLLFCLTILASSQKNAHSFLLPSAQTISLRNNGMGLLYSSPRSNFNFASSTQLYSTTPTPSQNEVVSFSTENKGQPALLEAIAKFSPSTTIDACRIFHGRGGLYPGADHLTLDYYPPVFLLTSFEALPDEEVDVYSRALKDLWEESAVKNADEVGTEENEQVEVEGTISDGEITDLKPIPFTWVYQCRAERKNSTTQLMSGIMPNPHIVTENNGKNKFLVHLLKGQNHGLFLDMASGRKWLQTKCEEDDVVSVLNLFAYTCAFSIAALNGGADTVVNVDMSRGALKTGQRSHEINGLTQAGGAKFLAHDIFKTWYVFHSCILLPIMIAGWLVG